MRRSGRRSGRLLLLPLVPAKTATWESCSTTNRRGTLGEPFRKTLRGEAARAFQHELDHLDGILIVDHAGIDELPAAIASLERPYHDARQRRAFARRVYQGETLYY